MNELMTGLQCQCGHDYACHAPAPYTGCGECDCTISRADVAERGGKLLATAIAERDALQVALEDLLLCHSGGGFVQPDADVLTAGWDAIKPAKGEA